MAAAITKTLPRENGERNARLFEFARHLRAVFPKAAVTAMKPYVKEWHKQARDHIGTKSFAESWTDFERGWNSVKYLPGQGPTEQIFAQVAADDSPSALAIAAGYEDEPKMHKLFRLVEALQEHVGDRSFFLPISKVVEILGVSRTTSWRLLKALKIDGFLRTIEKGTKYRAERYRFDPSPKTVRQ